MTPKPYEKPLLSFADQAKQLRGRGMSGDLVEMERLLTTTNYYRLSGYFYFFRKHQGPNRHLGEEYRDGTSFETIWELYTFDSKLRALVTAAIERIEIAVRTQISFHHAKKFDLFAYALNPNAVVLNATKKKSAAERGDSAGPKLTHPATPKLTHPVVQY